MRAQGQPTRIKSLDGLRGLAIIGVLIAHSSLRWDMTPSDLPLDRFWEFLVSGGRFGVELFFLLSAFLITGILLQVKGDGGSLRSFYSRRALRILPLYYIVLLVVLPMQSPGKIAGWEPWYWFNVSNWAMSMQDHISHSGYSVLWSLAVEEQFYLVWPILVLLVPASRLLHVAMTGVVAALAFRFACLLSGVSTDAVYFMTPAHFDSLGIGASLALLSKRSGGLTMLASRARWSMVAAGAVILATGAVLGGFPSENWHVATVTTSAISIFFGSVLVLALTNPGEGIVGRVASMPMLQTFGRYSYCLYLIHIPVDQTLRVIAYGGLWELLAPLGPFGHLVIWAATVCASLAIAWLSWRYLEAPLLSLKRFLPYTPMHQSRSLQPVLS